MRLTILFGVLAFAIGCSGDGTGPSDTIDSGPPKFEVVGDYHLSAVEDRIISDDSISTGSYIDACASSYMDDGSYLDECFGSYSLFVGPRGTLSLYEDGTYGLRYTETMVISWAYWPFSANTQINTVDFSGQWRAIGTMRDTLLFTDSWRQVVGTDRELCVWYVDVSVFRLDILRGVLRGESARRTSTTGRVLITPSALDLYMDQPFAVDSIRDVRDSGWNSEQGGAWCTIDNTFKLTFRNWD